MKNKLGLSEKRPLADFLPTVTIKAKDLANEITTVTLKRETNIQGEERVTQEHVKNNLNVRDLLKKSNIFPEELPGDEDIKKLERRLKTDNKNFIKNKK